MLHQLQSHYHWDAGYILWHDWDWIDGRLKKVSRDLLSNRRWGLYVAAAAAMLQSMSPSDDMFKSLLDSTFTDEEKARMDEEEEQRQLEELEEQRKERLAAMGLSTVFTTNK